MVYMQVSTSTGAFTIGVTPVPTGSGFNQIATIGFVDGVTDSGLIVGKDLQHIIGYQYHIGGLPSRLGPLVDGGYPMADYIFPAAISNGDGLMCGYDAHLPAGTNC